MRHIAMITKQQPAAAQTNFQVLLDGLLTILTTLVGGFGDVLGTFQLTQLQRAFKSGGIGGEGGGGNIGAGF
jgi:hypothetical protein